MSDKKNTPPQAKAGLDVKLAARSAVAILAQRHHDGVYVKWSHQDPRLRVLIADRILQERREAGQPIRRYDASRLAQKVVEKQRSYRKYCKPKREQQLKLKLEYEADARVKRAFLMDANHSGTTASTHSTHGLTLAVRPEHNATKLSEKLDNLKARLPKSKAIPTKASATTTSTQRHRLEQPKTKTNPFARSWSARKQPITAVYGKKFVPI